MTDTNTILNIAVFVGHVCVSVFGQQINNLIRTTPHRYKAARVTTLEKQLERLETIHNNAYALVRWALSSVLFTAVYTAWFIIAGLVVMFYTHFGQSVNKQMFVVAVTAGTFLGRVYVMREMTTRLYHYEVESAKLRARIARLRELIAARQPEVVMAREQDQH